jgi:hypothetical protein
LAHFNLSEHDRHKPEIAAVKMITNVDAYEAQLVNQTSRGGLLLRGQTLCVLEVAPASYVMLAANEAEKAAQITLVHYQSSGRFGRLYISAYSNAGPLVHTSDSSQGRTRFGAARLVVQTRRR